jgi:hypothetical protein
MVRKALLLCIIGTLLSACTNEFLGAKKITYGETYVSRWFLNPEYNESDIPSGTAFYGAAANKIKYRFIVKYYAWEDGNNEKIIPNNHMWTVNHNGKRFNLQDDDSLFFYRKSPSGDYQKYPHKKGSRYMAAIAKESSLLPVKKCNLDGWCQLYPTWKGIILYVQKKVLKAHL